MMSKFILSRMKRGLFCLSLCCLLGVSQAQAEVLKLSDGTVWWTSFSPNVTLSSIEGKVTADGKQQLWYTLDRQKSVKDNFRTELSGRPKEFDRPYSVDFTLMLPDDWKSDNMHEVLFQFHRQEDADEVGQSTQPVVALIATNNNLNVSHCYSTAKLSWDKYNQKCTTSSPFTYLKAGGVYKIHFDLKFSRGDRGRGYIRISVDGVPTYGYDGPVGSDDDIAPYPKFGIYKSPWRPNSGMVSTTTQRHYGYEGMKVEAGPAPASSTMLPADATSVADMSSADMEAPVVEAAPAAPTVPVVEVAPAAPAAPAQSNFVATLSPQVTQTQMDQFISFMKRWFKK